MKPILFILTFLISLSLFAQNDSAKNRILIPAGEFNMGKNTSNPTDWQPEHKVSRGLTPRAMPNGLVNDCPPMPNGNMPAVEDWSIRIFTQEINLIPPKPILQRNSKERSGLNLCPQCVWTVRYARKRLGMDR